MPVIMIDNSAQVRSATRQQIQKALTRCGEKALEYAQGLVPKDTTQLMQSIAYTVQDNTMVIGTNVEYGIYVEMGTGIYASEGGGRDTPWVYQDARGDWHWTHGQHPQPWLKPTIADYAPNYKALIEDTLKNG